MKTYTQFGMNLLFGIQKVKPAIPKGFILIEFHQDFVRAKSPDDTLYFIEGLEFNQHWKFFRLWPCRKATLWDYVRTFGSMKIGTEFVDLRGTPIFTGPKRPSKASA